MQLCQLHTSNPPPPKGSVLNEGEHISRAMWAISTATMWSVYGYMPGTKAFWSRMSSLKERMLQMSIILKYHEAPPPLPVLTNAGSSAWEPTTQHGWLWTNSCLLRLSQCSYYHYLPSTSHNPCACWKGQNWSLPLSGWGWQLVGLTQNYLLFVFAMLSNQARDRVTFAWILYFTYFNSFTDSHNYFRRIFS